MSAKETMTGDRLADEIESGSWLPENLAFPENLPDLAFENYMRADIRTYLLREDLLLCLASMSVSSLPVVPEWPLVHTRVDSDLLACQPRSLVFNSPPPPNNFRGEKG